MARFAMMIRSFMGGCRSQKPQETEANINITNNPSEVGFVRKLTWKRRSDVIVNASALEALHLTENWLVSIDDLIQERPEDANDSEDYHAEKDERMLRLAWAPVAARVNCIGIRHPYTNIECFDLMRTVGTGGYGRVRIAKLKTQADEVCCNRQDCHIDAYLHKAFAIKSIYKSSIIKGRQVRHIIHEKLVMTSVHHPFIAKMYGSLEDKHYIHFLMEYVNGGEFFSLLRSRKTLSENFCRFYASNVVLVFAYLHMMKIGYRDLKPENLLMTAEGYFKFADFGFAKPIVDRTYTLCGTPEYIAPEILMSKGHSLEVDWWTLGILIFEMHAGYAPFRGNKALDIYEKIKTGSFRFPSSFTEGTRSIVTDLLQPNIAVRLGSGPKGYIEVMDHPWFRTTEWLQILMKRIVSPIQIDVASPFDDHLFDQYEEPAKSTRSSQGSIIQPFMDAF